jgi:hypothetical protein
MVQSLRSRRIACLVICTFLYALALYLPAVLFPPFFRDEYVPVTGFQCLQCPIVPLWCANPLIFVGLVFLVIGRQSAARLCGMAATGLSASLLLIVLPGFLKSWASGDNQAPGFGFPLLPGYFMWLASMMTLVYFTADLRSTQPFLPEFVGSPPSSLSEPDFSLFADVKHTPSTVERSA